MMDDVHQKIDTFLNELEDFLVVTVSNDKWLDLGAKIYSKRCRIVSLLKDVKENLQGPHSQKSAFPTKTSHVSPAVVSKDTEEDISDDEEYVDIDEKKDPPVRPPPRDKDTTEDNHIDTKQNGNTIEGWLEKKKPDKLLAKIGSSFQKRWCVIKGHYLYYYEKPDAKKENGKINLRGYEFVLQSDDNVVKDVNKKGLYFALLCPGQRTYFFTAQNTKELRLWQKAVDNAGQLDMISMTSEDNRTADISLEEDDDEYVDPVSQKPDDVEEFYDDNQVDMGTDEGITEEYYDECGVTTTNTNNRPPMPVEDRPSIKQEIHINYNNYYLGMWDSAAEFNNELGFKRGDLIYILSKQCGSNNWWIGQIEEKVGLVPKEYLFKAYDIA